MQKFKRRQIFLIYVIVFAIASLIFKTIIVNAKETVVKEPKISSRVFKVEIKNNPNFEDVKKKVLADDIKYVVHPEKLGIDVSLSEIIASDIDYSSYAVQEVELEVQRFVQSKSDKAKIDSVVGIVRLQFIDTTPPEVLIKKDSVTITEGEELDVNDYLISVTDNSFEPVALEIEDDLDTNVPGEYTTVYTATDSSGNTDSKTLTVIVKEKPKPKPEPIIIKPVTSTKVASSSGEDFVALAEFSPSRVTRYGYDCRGCRVNGSGFSSTASGIQIGADSVRQANGQWQYGYTYEGYHIIAASQSLPLFSIVKISNHPFSGGGIVAGQPFYAIVGDRGVGGTAIDLFIGTESNMGVISQSGSPNNSGTKVELVRSGR